MLKSLTNGHRKSKDVTNDKNSFESKRFSNIKEVETDSGNDEHNDLLSGVALSSILNHHENRRLGDLQKRNIKVCVSRRGSS